MADINFTPIVEGDAVTAASLSTPFLQIQNGVNALEAYSVRDGALRAEHVPSIIPVATTMGDYIKETAGGPAAELYSNAFPGFTSNTHLGDGAGGGTGWRGVQVPAAGVVCGITFASLSLNTSGQPRALAIFANIEMMDIYDNFDADDNAEFAAAFGIMWYNNINWTLIQRATRCINMNRERGVLNAASKWRQRVDIPLRTLIVPDDIPGGQTIYGVKAVVSCHDATAVTTWNQPRVGVARFNFLCLPIYGNLKL